MWENTEEIISDIQNTQFPYQDLSRATVRGILEHMESIAFYQYAITQIESGKKSYEDLAEEEEASEDAGCLQFIHRLNPPTNEAIESLKGEIQNQRKHVADLIRNDSPTVVTLTMSAIVDSINGGVLAINSN